jgi:hypothetical protein
MEANELRIGNWIKIKEEHSHVDLPLETFEFKIKGFNDGSERHKEGAKQILFWNIKNKIFGTTSGGSYDIECEPIPLTEEWLKNFGFSLMTDTTPYNYRIHKNKSFCYIRYGTFGTFENGIEKSFKGFNGLFIANKFVRVIKYVHELQNLYFGLTGEELNLHVGIQGKNDE